LLDQHRHPFDDSATAMMPMEIQTMTKVRLPRPREYGDPLARMCEGEREVWANAVMYEAGHDLIALALDIMGWKIVQKEPSNGPRWLFDSAETGCTCPDWCDDLSPSPPGMGYMP
jgi:hypothetical protein